MIKKLRRNFILVAMCSIFVVLAVIMGVVNTVNYVRMTERADEMTEMLSENSGEIQTQPEKDAEKFPMFPRDGKGNPETPFETRFFSVALDEAGEVISVNLDHIAAVNQETAEEYAREIADRQSEKGFQDIYRYRAAGKNGGMEIIFVDCRRELNMYRNFLLLSLLTAGAGLLAVFGLVVLLSKKVFGTVAESYEKQKRFITDASHEIKTPLTIIDANTEVLEMENGENQWTRSTKKQIRRLTALTQQMTVLSRLDESQNMTSGETINLSENLRDNVLAFEPLAERQGKHLELEIEDNIFFQGDEVSVSQLLGVLIDNAIKYSPEHTSIRVSLKRKGKKAQLEILNETNNIPKGNLDILFERFYRLDASRNSETGGSGIGLSVAQAIVRANKGKITAYSFDGKSIVITILLDIVNKLPAERV